LFLRQLHYLVALAEHRHFAQAAESCWVSQPSLSVALQQMERELGITIIRRERRFQGFTPEGERVLDWARKTLSSLDGLKQEAALAQAVAGGNLVIGAVPSAMRAVSTLIKEYRRVIPRLNLKVFSLSTRDILNRLKNQDLHLGIAYSDASAGEIYESLSLYAERFVLLSNNEVVPPVGDAFSWVDVGELPLCLFNHAKSDTLSGDVLWRIDFHPRDNATLEQSPRIAQICLRDAQRRTSGLYGASGSRDFGTTDPVAQLINALLSFTAWRGLRSPMGMSTCIPT